MDNIRMVQGLQDVDLDVELLQESAELHLHLALVDHLAGELLAVALTDTAIALGSTTYTHLFFQLIYHVEGRLVAGGGGGVRRCGGRRCVVALNGHRDGGRGRIATTVAI